MPQHLHAIGLLLSSRGLSLHSSSVCHCTVAYTYPSKGQEGAQAAAFQCERHSPLLALPIAQNNSRCCKSGRAHASLHKHNTRYRHPCVKHRLPYLPPATPHYSTRATVPTRALLPSANHIKTLALAKVPPA